MWFFKSYSSEPVIHLIRPAILWFFKSVLIFPSRKPYSSEPVFPDVQSRLKTTVIGMFSL